MQLLLGEIPDRAIFRAPASRKPMRAYLKLVQAVRLGDLSAFRSAMHDHRDTFESDGNYSLVVRLRQNVIRAGLRNIALAYTRISLTAAAAKLALDNPSDMESIAAKAHLLSLLASCSLACSLAYCSLTARLLLAYCSLTARLLLPCSPLGDTRWRD